jgi:hypothetical protein
METATSEPRLGVGRTVLIDVLCTSGQSRRVLLGFELRVPYEAKGAPERQAKTGQTREASIVCKDARFE